MVLPKGTAAHTPPLHAPHVVGDAGEGEFRHHVLGQHEIPVRAMQSARRDRLARGRILHEVERHRMDSRRRFQVTSSRAFHRPRTTPKEVPQVHDSPSQVVGQLVIGNLALVALIIEPRPIFPMPALRLTAVGARPQWMPPTKPDCILTHPCVLLGSKSEVDSEAVPVITPPGSCRHVPLTRLHLLLLSESSIGARNRYVVPKFCLEFFV